MFSGLFRRALVGATVSGSILYGAHRYCNREAPVAMCLSKDAAGVEKPSLPYYSAEEVAQHNHHRSEKGVWVTYKAGVYDVTNFIKDHPGGEKRIMLAAGGAIDKWWAMFNIHDEDAVRDILESHRIGNLKGYVPQVTNTEEMWKKEPKRSPGLQVLNSRPFNAQSPEGIMDEFYTPNDLFFVRNHMPVPDLRDKPDFCVQVEGDGVVSHCFTVEELKRQFSQHTIAATIQCGGNRRSEMTAAHAGENGKRAVKGLSWACGGIGTATWRGVWLREVIESCQQAHPSHPEVYHVQFEGADSDAAGHFHVSIPYGLAMEKEADVMLAFDMNGEPLPPDQGYPLRVVVPGVVGVRNCKWVQRVTVQPFEAQSVWQQNDYKNYPSWETKPDPKYPTLYYMPVQSSLTDAAHDAAEDAVSVKGYAYCGGGTGIQRVEVSYDGGKSFETAATILPPPPSAAVLQDAGEHTKRKNWAWRQFQSSTPVEDITAHPVEGEDGRKLFKTCIRAITDDNAVQPAVAEYNFRGLLYNGYSCRDVYVE